MAYYSQVYRIKNFTSNIIYFFCLFNFSIINLIILVGYKKVITKKWLEKVATEKKLSFFKKLYISAYSYTLISLLYLLVTLFTTVFINI